MLMDVMQVNLNRRTRADVVVRRSVRERAIGGLSLIELLIVMALLSFIVLGLMAVFDQTQRAFKTGMAQVDVLEGGRAAMDRITREVQEIAPLPGGRVAMARLWVDLYAKDPQAKTLPATEGWHLINAATFEPDDFPNDPDGYFFHEEFPQLLPGGSTSRTNYFQTLFFTLRDRQVWRGVAYLVLGDSGDYLEGARDGVGALYRYETAVHARALPGESLSGGLLGRFNRDYNDWRLEWAEDRSAARPPEAFGFRRVLDGVIHFSVSSYVTNGYRVTPDDLYAYGATNQFLWLRDGFVDAGYRATAQGDVAWGAGGAVAPLTWERIDFRFLGDTVPTAVEIELGVVEPEVAEKVNAIGAPAAAERFLNEQVGKVHIFKQRVPIHSVNPRAYDQ